MESFLYKAGTKASSTGMDCIEGGGGDGRAHRQEGASEAAWREREEVVGVWVPGAWVREYIM